MTLTSEKISLLVRDLWSLYLQDIRSGMPVYFSFTKSQIREVLIKSNLISSDYVSDFSSISRTFLEIKKDQVSIKKLIYDPVWNQTSSLIILIALQVLAVEMMDKSEQGIGADAYFPRLRKILCLENDIEGRNPFLDQEFTLLWEKFKKEIFELGGTVDSITFFEGNGRKDKNRNFPISQALLNQNELLQVSSKIYFHANDFPKTSEIFEILGKLRNEFTTRVREKIDRPFQKLKIADQIHTFLKKVSIDKLRLPTINKTISKNDEIIWKAFLDGFMDEEIVLEAYTASGEKLDDQEKYLTSLIKDSMLILGRPSENSFFWTTDIQMDLVSMEDFLIFYSDSKTTMFNYFSKNYLTEISSSKKLNFSLGGATVVRLSKADIKRNCLIKQGKEVQSNFDKLPDDIDFTGGIYLGSSKYLCGFPFFSITYKGSSISSSETGSINGKEMKLADILFKLNQAKPNEKFEVRYKNSQKEITFVEANKTTLNVLFGYKIDKKLLVPNKQEITDSNSSVIGFKVLINEFTRILKIPSYYAILLAKDNYKNGIPLKEEQLSNVLESVEKLDIKSHLKSIIKININSTGCIPKMFSDFL